MSKQRLITLKKLKFHLNLLKENKKLTKAFNQFCNKLLRKMLLKLKKNLIKFFFELTDKFYRFIFSKH